MARAEQFVDEWFQENYYFEGFPAESPQRDPQSESMAIDCLQAAEEAGITREDLINEVGDLAEHIRRKLDYAATEHMRNQAAKDD